MTSQDYQALAGDEDILFIKRAFRPSLTDPDADATAVIRLVCTRCAEIDAGADVAMISEKSVETNR